MYKSKISHSAHPLKENLMLYNYKWHVLSFNNWLKSSSALNVRAFHF